MNQQTTHRPAGRFCHREALHCLMRIARWGKVATAMALTFRDVHDDLVVHGVSEYWACGEAFRCACYIGGVPNEAAFAALELTELLRH